MKKIGKNLFCALLLGVVIVLPLQAQEVLKYNNEGLVTDLGVGLWAWSMPMDWDSDGDLDLIVSCPDTPYNGTYFFENKGDDPKTPIFEKGVKIDQGLSNVQVSQVDGEPVVLRGRSDEPTVEYIDFLGNDFNETKELDYPSFDVGEGNTRAKQWKYVDFDGDGALDLIHGAGFWGDYGWDDAFNDEGEWQRGPLHGYVYVLLNKGSDNEPDYDEAYRLQANGEDLDVFGMPSPNFDDFDGDGDLDIICGEFLDGFTYFENTGSRTDPVYAEGSYLKNNGKKVSMHVQMITPSTIDWDEDGDIDIISGDEDGRVAFVENTGTFENEIPLFEQPVYFEQQADDVKFGALSTPFGVDWDGDGDEDIITGNTAGNIGFIENLDGGNLPTWAKPVLLKAGGETIHIQAGSNGSIQGPAEAKWGYTVLNVADWDQDGLQDIVVNSIWGKVIWYKNTGTETQPELAEAQAVEVEWNGTPPKPAWNWWDPEGNELVTQWRTTPCIVDWNKDGLNDLVMLDHEGYLAFFERKKEGDEMLLLPGKRIFRMEEGSSNNDENMSENDTEAKQTPLRLNDDEAGGSGRRKIAFTDWDGDGDLDLLVNSKNATLMENTGTDDKGMTIFADRGVIGERRLAGHTSAPATVDWNKDGIRDLLVGGEDGRFYYLENPRAE
jgi:hypothetical protein